MAKETMVLDEETINNERMVQVVSTEKPKKVKEKQGRT